MQVPESAVARERRFKDAVRGRINLEVLYLQNAVRWIQLYIDSLHGADYGKGSLLAGGDEIPLILLDRDACLETDVFAVVLTVILLRGINWDFRLAKRPKGVREIWIGAATQGFETGCRVVRIQYRMDGEGFAC